MTAFPLSFAQHRLWFLHAMDPTGFAHSTGRCFRITGDLDLAALQRALDTLVARHEALRTTFPIGDAHAPEQRIHATGAIPLQIIEGDPAQHARAIVEAPYDLARGPLIRAAVLRDRAAHHLVLAIHLLVADGWSLQILCRELGAAYRAAITGSPISLPELPVQYADWAAWHREQLTESRRAALVQWWRDELSGTPLSLALAHRPAAPHAPGRRIHRAIDPATMAAVLAFAAREGHTPFSVLAAACGAVLGRHSGQDRLLIGVAVANRAHADVEHVLGFFVHTVALRVDLTGDQSFAALVARIADATRRATDHQALPFEHLVSALAPARDARRAPVIQTNFAYHPPGSAGTLALAGCSVVEQLLDAATVKFELTLRVEHTAHGAVLWAELDPALVDGDAIARVMAAYTALLDAAMLDPTRALSSLLPPPAIAPAIARAFATTLGVDRVAPHDDFFALGGQSLQLIELASRIHAATGHTIALHALYAAPTVAAVVAQLEPSRSP